jgi:hypothetical protein
MTVSGAHWPSWHGYGEPVSAIGPPPSARGVRLGEHLAKLAAMRARRCLDSGLTMP